MNDNLISRIESYLAACAPMHRQRPACKLLAEALAELKRVNVLKGEMMIKDYSHDKLKATLRELGKDKSKLDLSPNPAPCGTVRFSQ